jgi:hypothetical protein
VVAGQYPGYRILTATDIDPAYRPTLSDGTRGGLLVGRFDFDDHEDFAALIVPPSTTNYYPGRLVVCSGTANPAAFRCERAERIIQRPSTTVLERVPAGTYSCYVEERLRTVITQVDSVGIASADGLHFTARRRDGTRELCVRAD